MSDIISNTVLGYAKTHLLDGETPKEQNLGAVIHMMRKILAASTTARKEGLLALEECAIKNKFGTTADAVFANGLLLVVDGTDPEFVREILSNKILVHGLDTFEAYLFYLGMEGCLMIQAGMNPRIIEEIMYSYLPLSLVDCVSKVIREEQEEFSESYKQQLIKRWNEYQPKSTDNPFIGMFEEKMSFYSDREIQKIIREVEFDDLGLILTYCKAEIKNSISNNLSENVKANLMDSLWYMSESDLTPALDKVLRVINKLEAYGEIRSKEERDTCFGGVFSENDDDDSFDEVLEQLCLAVRDKEEKADS